jgi:hypothetical protein
MACFKVLVGLTMTVSLLLVLKSLLLLLVVVVS